MVVGVAGPIAPKLASVDADSQPKMVNDPLAGASVVPQSEQVHGLMANRPNIIMVKQR